MCLCGKKGRGKMETEICECGEPYDETGHCPNSGCRFEVMGNKINPNGHIEPKEKDLLEAAARWKVPIKSVEQMKLDPTDILVVKVAGRIVPEHKRLIREQIRNSLNRSGHQNQIIVIDDSIGLFAISKARKEISQIN